MQSIFRPASRREALGEHSGGDRRDGGLKMGWLCGVWIYVRSAREEPLN
jgi:hypothetical protein